MNIPDHISEVFETIFWVKMNKFVDAVADPGSGNLFDPGFGINCIEIVGYFFYTGAFVFFFVGK
jgi:hypothetical protein